MNQTNIAHAQPMSDIQAALSRLTLAQNELSGILSSLSEKLVPVLRIEPPQPDSKGGVSVVSVSAPLADALNDRADHIEREIQFLNGLHGRIAL